MKSTYTKLAFCLIVPLIILLLPSEAFGIGALTTLEQRTIALFFLAALFWILEPIPIYATSILIIVIELLTFSTSGLKWLVTPSASFGEPMAYAKIMGTLASPIILLFLGGFFLAAAAVKYQLDQNLARVLLKPFGRKTSVLLLGIMAITGFFSMFMSNTATTAMMLSITLPLMVLFDPSDKGRIAFTLAIPVAANIGGIGTPIGTPPNAIALKYLSGNGSITFGEWMIFGIPLVVTLILIGWGVLLWFFKPTSQTLDINIPGKFQKGTKAYIVYGTFILTVGLWLTDFWHGMNSYTIGMIPVAIFLATGVINKEDLKKISWDVLWLVSGGIALGLAIEDTGLATHLVQSIPFASFSGFTIIVIGCLIGVFMANFMSNTATANLVLPIMAAIGVTSQGLDAFGGTQALILGVTLSISMGMSLPISTPPNAIAHATGMFQIKDMVKVGVTMAILGLSVIWVALFIMGLTGFNQ